MDSCWSLSLLLIALTACQGRDVEYTGPKYVAVGDDIRIHCTGADYQSISWTRDGLAIGTGGQVTKDTLYNGEGSSDLTIPRARPQHSGVYKCSADSYDGHEVRVLDGSEVVYDGPNFVNEGQPAALSCYVTAYDSPRWVKEGHVVDAGELERKVLQNGAQVFTLKIYRTRPGDAGIYKCVNTSPNRHVLHVIDDDITIAKRKTQLVPGMKLFLPCEPDIEHPRMIWSRNGQVLTPSEEEGYELQRDNDGLLITNAECKHAGNYTCNRDSGSVYYPGNTRKSIQVLSYETCGAASIYVTTTSLLVLVCGVWLGQI